MTETQTNHRAPLAPGEIRTYRVGDQRFAVMHVAGGSFTQVTARDGIDGATRVLATCRFADAAVRAYADAIEQAESDAVDRLDDTDGMSFDASGAYLEGEPRRVLVVEEREIVHRCPPTGSNTMPCCGVTPWEIPTYHRMTVEDDRVTCKPKLDAAEICAEAGIATTPEGGMTPETVSWVSRPDGSGLRRAGERSWVTDEPLGEMLPTPEPGSLSALLDAYGEAMARGGIELASGRTVQDGITAAVAHTTRADALKAEILARFGGER
jgi:hypothetical protein